MSVHAPGVDLASLRQGSPMRKHLRARIARALGGGEETPPLAPLRIHVVAIHGWHWRDSANRAKSCDYSNLARAALRMEILADVRELSEFYGESVPGEAAAPGGSPASVDEDALMERVVRVSHTPLSGCENNDQTLRDRVSGCMQELEDPLGGPSETVLDICTEEDRESLSAGKFTGLQLLADADIVWFVAHSQGAAVSVLVLDRLLDLGVLRPPLDGTNNNSADVSARPQHITLLSMAGVHQGTWETASALAVNRPATQEFYQLAKPKSPLFRDLYAPALKRITEAGIMSIACAGFGDLIVTLQSATMDGWDHPNIIRALFAPQKFAEFASSWDANSPGFHTNEQLPVHAIEKFLLALSLLAVQIRNQGSDERMARFARSTTSVSTEVLDRVSGILRAGKDAYEVLPEDAESTGWLGSVGVALARAGSAVKREVEDAAASAAAVKASHSHIHHTLDVYRLGAVLALHAVPTIDREVGEAFVADNVPLTMDECDRFVQALDRLESKPASSPVPSSLPEPVAVRLLQDLFFSASGEEREFLQPMVRKVLEARNFGISERVRAHADQLLALLPGLTRQETIHLLKEAEDDVEEALAAGQKILEERGALAASFVPLDPGELPPQYPVDGRGRL